MDDTKMLGEILMTIGCLHDIREKSKEHYTTKQLADVEKRLLSILFNRFPVEIVKIIS